MIFSALLFALVQPNLSTHLLQSSVESRVNDTLAQMTVDEKIDLISGVRGFYVRGVPRLGVPELKMSDGPVGVRNDGPTTAYPAGVCMAASFDPDLAQRFGNGIGRDARSRGVNIWLGPGVNLARIPQNGRDFEYFGEDPFLAGTMAANVILAVQKQGVVTTVKHFAGNEHENDRNQDSSEVDERTLRELYLKPFEMAVKEGGTWAVMCGYNKLNGTYDSENSWLLTQVLRKDWGFQGVLMSDWGAVHSTLPSLTAGMDLEMPSGDFFNRGTVQPLLDNGQLPMSVLNEKVRRILRLTYSMGFDTRPQLDPSIPKDDPANEAVSLEIAREGIVLLKNKNNLLPLDRGKVKHIVVVGPNADPAVTGGGGSAYTTPATAISLLNAVKAVAGPGIEVTYYPLVTDMVAKAMTFRGYHQPDDPSKPGLKVERWTNPTLSGEPSQVRTERRINLSLLQGGTTPVPTNFSVRWTGTVTFDKTGPYLAASRSDDGIRVFLDDKAIIDDWNDHGAAIDTAQVEVVAGRSYKLRVEYYQHEGDAIAQFGFTPVSGVLENDVPAKDIAKADVVIASFGFNPSIEGEGNDRTYALPPNQLSILQKVLSLNPKTIVVNNSGSAVDMSPWVDKAAGLFQAWYPGGVGSQAIAEMIFGKINPSGKLPMTFPKMLKGTYYESAYPPVDHKVFYREGLFMGYRWFDANAVEPLFPFGFGLSYTSFALAHLHVQPDIPNGVLRVRLTVKNTGKVDGSETVQAYVHADKSSVKRPVRELKAFKRVFLHAGETKQVTMPIRVADVAYWNVDKHAWVVEPIRYDVLVGTSSRDLPLKAWLRVGNWTVK